MEFVCLFLINATPSISEETVFRAMLATIWLLANVFWLLSKIQVIMAAVPGTGKTKNAFNVLTIGFSTTMESACPYLINATPSISKETVSLAT